MTHKHVRNYSIWTKKGKGHWKNWKVRLQRLIAEEKEVNAKFRSTVEKEQLPQGTTLVYRGVEEVGRFATYGEARAARSELKWERMNVVGGVPIRAHYFPPAPQRAEDLVVR
eukprot:TRINITY_DN46168_c0_g1_i1.p2 TRINITY_DN46168_c0_g1~~TRINITY_DN46168_c0_g1_i1.p2  ORF type:complete len:112 (-),score=7.16 TRINITY_DN46168_c0_g1_i1:267-602(-)